MAEATDQQVHPPPGEGWQWAFSYLRQDIQDLRAEMREFQAEIRAEMRELRTEMREFKAEVREQLTEMNRRIDRHFSITITTMIGIGAVLAALIKL